MKITITNEDIERAGLQEVLNLADGESMDLQACLRQTGRLLNALATGAEKELRAISPDDVAVTGLADVIDLKGRKSIGVIEALSQVRRALLHLRDEVKEARAAASEIRPLLTFDQAAKIMGISHRTLESMVTNGLLKVIRIRRSVRIAPADLEAFINGSRAES